MHECAIKESDLVLGQEVLGPGTKEVRKSRDLKVGKVPGKMPTLVKMLSYYLRIVCRWYRRNLDGLGLSMNCEKLLF